MAEHLNFLLESFDNMPSLAIMNSKKIAGLLRGDDYPVVLHHIGAEAFDFI